MPSDKTESRRKCIIVVMIMVASSIVEIAAVTRREFCLRSASQRLYWMPAVGLADDVVLASVRRPICSMNAWLSTGGALVAV
jgi:hypothetical protein